MVRYIAGDLFQVLKQEQTGALIIGHACNCLGFWGAGVAVAFKKNFPSAYKKYKKHCQSASSPESLLGTTFLIPISPKDKGYTDLNGSKTLIACFFTSVMGGDSPSEITKNTADALKDMKSQLEKPAEIADDAVRSNILQEAQGEFSINIPKINAGIFRVPWEDTEGVLEDIGLPVTVYTI